MSNFEPGTVVWLKSGSPPMVVAEPSEGNGGDEVGLMFLPLHETAPKTLRLPEACLTTQRPPFTCSVCGAISTNEHFRQ